MIDSRKASESFFECTQTFEGTLQVITEQMLGRVNELNNLSEACALYVLHESLCGFKELVRHAERYFRVLDDMIAWDCSGKIKVWLNSSFGELSIVVD